jgi:hypothetical protein
MCSCAKASRDCSTMRAWRSWRAPAMPTTSSARRSLTVRMSRSSTSSFTRRAARRATHRRLIRGKARDVGCGIDRVLVSVVRNRHGHCRVLTAKRHLSHRTRCSRRRWLRARGTSRWSFRLPRRLPKGAYIIRTRAIDFAGNAQHPAATASGSGSRTRRSVSRDFLTVRSVRRPLRSRTTTCHLHADTMRAPRARTRLAAAQRVEVAEH